MYRITKDFRFSAAHHLPHMAPGHKCRRPHGHNYLVTVVLEAEELDRLHMVADYGDLADIGDWLDRTFDHRDLNAVLDQPTAEALAYHVWLAWHEAYPHLVEVVVSETPNTTAAYRA